MNKTCHREIPRVMIAGTASGSGKTTVTCALLTLMKRAGKTPAAFKCGPDYIDPMFHTAVLGVESTNLDPFFCDGGALRRILGENTADVDIALIEGVMGYYDGTGAKGTENSSHSVACAVDTPVVLVVNGKGAAVSILAVVRGFMEFHPESRIAGVLFNQVSAGTYAHLKKLMSLYFDSAVQPLGYIPRLPEEYLLESRHLGLVTAAEIETLREKLDRTADILGETISLDALTAIAQTAPPLSYEPLLLPRRPAITIACARDKAFCFYYKDHFSLLRQMGADIQFFSPLANEPVPDGADGLYIGGGYPELYSDALSANVLSRASVRKAVESGVPTIAECGGFMYLGQSIDDRAMCGALPHDSRNNGRLVRFGYVVLTPASMQGGLFGQAGMPLRGHEFHYYDSTDCGNAFTAEKTNGKTYPCAVYTDSLYAGYPHLSFHANSGALLAFYERCVEFKRKKESI